MSVKYLEILSDRKTVEINHKSEGYMFCMRGHSVASDQGETIYSCSSKMDFTCDNISFKVCLSNILTLVQSFCFLGEF